MQDQTALKVIGRYSYYVTKCLGQGSFGKVFEGFQNTTKMRVAIKKIDFKMLEKDSYLEQSIYSEIKILSKFKHSNIVELYEVLNSKRSLYIIMEFCQDGDLKKSLQKRGRYSEQEAFIVAKHIASGFRELFREKVIHRDLKPANILIHNNQYKICDFGFSKYVDNVFDVLKSCVGSPIYMAPQILEKQKYSYKCDIWSFGIIYFEMLHSSPPWRGINEMDLLKNIKSIQLRLADCFSQKTAKMITSMLVIQQDKRATWEDVFSFFGLTLESPVNKKDIMTLVTPAPNVFGLPMTPISSKSTSYSPHPLQISPRPLTPTQQQRPITTDQLINQHQLDQQQLQQHLLQQQQKMQQQHNVPLQQPQILVPYSQPQLQPQPQISVPSSPNTAPITPLKFLNKYFFEELAFRSHVCLQINSKLHILRRHNFSKHMFEKYILLVSWSIVYKFDKFKIEIQRIHDQQSLSFIVYQHQHAVLFHHDLILTLRNGAVGQDIQREPEWKRLLESTTLTSPDTYDDMLRQMHSKVMEELMEEVRVSQEDFNIEILLSLLDNICDMVAINEEIIKTLDIQFQKILKHRAEYQGISLEKSVFKVNNKLQSKKSIKSVFFS